MSTCQNSVDKLCSDAFSVHTENTCKTENRIGIVCEHFQVTFRALNSEHLKKRQNFSSHIRMRIRWSLRQRQRGSEVVSEWRTAFRGW